MYTNYRPLQPNEAGKKFIRLLKKWRTKKTIKPTKARSRETFRAFHGQYELEVIQMGSRVWGQSFRVQKGKGLDLDIDIEQPNPCQEAGRNQHQREQCEAEACPKRDDVTGSAAQQEVTCNTPPEGAM